MNKPKTREVRIISYYCEKTRRYTEYIHYLPFYETYSANMQGPDWNIFCDYPLSEKLFQTIHEYTENINMFRFPDEELGPVTPISTEEKELQERYDILIDYISNNWSEEDPTITTT